MSCSGRGARRSACSPRRRRRHGWMWLLWCLFCSSCWREVGWRGEISRAGRGDGSSAVRLGVIGFLGQLLAKCGGTYITCPRWWKAGTSRTRSNKVCLTGRLRGCCTWKGGALHPAALVTRARISRTRFLSGKGRDSMVAGHLLLGVACGVGMAVFSNALVVVHRWQQMAGALLDAEFLRPEGLIRHRWWNCCWWVHFARPHFVGTAAAVPAVPVDRPEYVGGGGGSGRAWAAVTSDPVVSAVGFGCTMVLDGIRFDSCLGC